MARGSIAFDESNSDQAGRDLRNAKERINEIHPEKQEYLKSQIDFRLTIVDHINKFKQSVDIDILDQYDGSNLSKNIELDKLLLKAVILKKEVHGDWLKNMMEIFQEYKKIPLKSDIGYELHTFAVLSHMTSFILKHKRMMKEAHDFMKVWRDYSNKRGCATFPKVYNIN